MKGMEIDGEIGEEGVWWKVLDLRGIVATSK